MRPFQSLGGMQCRQRDLVGLLLAFRDGGNQRDGLRDFEHRLDLAFCRDAAAVVDLAAAALCHPVAEVDHVAPARGGGFLAVLAVVQVLLVADVFEPVAQEGLGCLGAAGVARAVLEVVEVAAEFVQARQRARVDRRRQRMREQRLEQAELVLGREAAELGQRLVADAALGGRDRAQEGRVVVVVDQQPQPGAEVLDLGPVEEALSARDLVRDLRPAQRGFQRTRLVVGTVQDREVLERLVLVAGAQTLDACHRALGFVVFLVTGTHAHRLALAEFAPERLREQLGVRADHVVGRAQDGAGRAVVLLELDHAQLGVVLRQFLQVVERRATPAVDRLVVIAHRGEAAALADQQFQQLVLGRVGVLVLVDQHMAELLLPFFAHLGKLAQQFQRQRDQVVEVHALVGRQSFLVARHHERDHAFSLVLGLGQRLLGVQAGALPAADGPLPLARGRCVGAAAAVLQNAGDVVGVEDRELALEPERLAVLAQQPHPERVEGADQHVLGGLADQLARALAHLGRRLVGEGDGRDPIRRQPGLDQASDLVRDHPRLARAGTGQHQAGAAEVIDGIELGDVQTG